MGQTTTCEVWVCVDACGDCAIGEDADAARASYEEDVSSLSECDGFRLIKVLVKVPLPEIATLEVEALAPGLEVPGGEAC